MQEFTLKMFCQAQAEDNVRALRKDEKYLEACRKGETYIRFFPHSNRLKEELSLSYFLNQEYQKSYLWLNNIDVASEPPYIKEAMIERVENNRVLIEKELWCYSTVPMVSVIIDGRNRTKEEIECISRRAWKMCNQKDLVHSWIVVSSDIDLIGVFENFTVLDSIIFETTYILFVDDLPTNYYNISDLIFILENDILISHVLLPSEKLTTMCAFQKQNSFYFECKGHEVKNRMFFTSKRMFSEIHEENKSIEGYNTAIVGIIKNYESLHPICLLQKPVYKSFIINLSRRTDRLEKLSEIHDRLPIFERSEACDGLKIVPTPRLKALCKQNDYSSRSGVIGCALSHLKIMVQLIQDSVDGYVIFEDDIFIPDDFKERLDRILSIAHERERGIIFLASVPLQCKRSINSQYKIKGIVDLESHHWQEIAGGTGCYYISKTAAQQVLEYVDNYGLHSPIDMILMFNKHVDFKTSFCLPPVVSQYDIDTTSDVQNQPHRIEFENVETSQYKIFGSENQPDFFNI